MEFTTISYCEVFLLNFVISDVHSEVMAISSVTTAIIVCSSPLCQTKIEWLTADLLNPSSLINTVASVFYCSHPACFNPYNAFSSLQTMFS